MKSKFRMGWLFVCFDLPVIEKWQMKEASKFRKNLLDLGYFMVQKSIYVRNCVSYEKTESHVKKVKSIAPQLGSILIFFITDKQWGSSTHIELTGYLKSLYSINPAEKAPKQMTFW